MIFFRNKIDFRIFILIVGIFATAFVWIIIEQIRNVMVNRYIYLEAEKELVLTQNSAKILEIHIKDLEEKLNLVVLTPEIQNPIPSTCQKKLEDIVALFHNRMNALNLVDSNKKVVCSTVGFAPKADVSTHPNVIEAFKTKKLILGRTVFGVAAKRYLVSLITPIYKNGEFDSILSGSIFLENFRDSYLAGYGVYGYGNMIVFDDNGDIMHHYYSDLIGKNEYGKEVENDPRTRPIIKTALEKGITGISETLTTTFNGKLEHVSFAPVNVFPGRKWVVVSVARNEDVQKRVDKFFLYKGYNIYDVYHIISIAVITLIMSILTLGYTFRKQSIDEK